jgi:hypothetical protein
MKIYWNRIFALILLAAALWVGLAHRHSIGQLLATMTLIGSGHDLDDQIRGLIAFSLVTISLMAIVLQLTQNKK